MILGSILSLVLAPFGHDHYISRDAGWCWFADPRAIWVDDKIVAGGVNQAGDVTVTTYDPVKKHATTATLASQFEKDDHDNPAFLKLPNGHLASIYSKHTGTDMFMAVSTRPGDATQWNAPAKISPNNPAFVGPKGGLNGYCYPNPHLLSAERNRIYLAWRGMNWKPTMSWSDDLGKSWSPGKIIVSPDDQNPRIRPYFKTAGNGKDLIHFAFTDDHPRNAAHNSIYYARYQRGAFRGISGQVISKIGQLPFKPSDADVVYDGRSEGVRSWIWDISQDTKGNPVIVYVRLHKDDDHRYRYVTWNGRRWVDRPVVDGGKWFPQTPSGQTEQEPHYSGGIVIDPSDSRFVYLSRPIDGRFEIERWFTPDNGDHWSHVALTGHSKHDSVRPFVIRGNRPFGQPSAAFLNLNRYRHYTDYAAALQASNEDRGPFVASQPLRAADAVWQWIRSNPSTYVKTEWMLAPLYSGVLDYAAFTGNQAAEDWVRNIGDGLDYKLGPRPMMADDQAVGQTYLQLFGKQQDPKMIESVRRWADTSLDQAHSEPLEWVNGIHNREWAWCDALYMAPPALAMLSSVTGDSRYLDLCSRLWWKTSDYLFDPTESLFFRDSRYFAQREANGKKVFWSRGNGWVLAGLARVLANTPKGNAHRARWEEQFRTMAKRIAGLQTPDGSWHASLLDPASFPAAETSGTGFFCYALAWGVRDGLLDRTTYEPVIRRAFAKLCDSIDPSGRLGYVQPIGQDPRTVSAFDTDSYGVGAFLLAAIQVAQL